MNHPRRLSRIAQRLDTLMTPRLERPAEELEDVDRMDWELWLLVILVLLMLALAFLLNHFPDFFRTPTYVPKAAEIEIYLDGFAILVLIFTMYVIQKHRQLVRARRRIVMIRIENAGLEHRLGLIRMLFVLGNLVTGRLARGSSYEEVLTHLVEVMGAAHASLWFADAPGGALRMDSYRGDRIFGPDTVVEYGDGPIGGVAYAARAMILDRDRDVEGLRVLFPDEGRLGDAMIVPLILDAEVLGVLLLTSGIWEQRFTEADLQTIQIFAGTLAASHRVSVLLQELRMSLKRNEETQVHLVQAEKLAALGELMAGISHELNNPLSVVMGQSELLLEYDVDQDVRRRLVTMREEAARSKRLVDNLLRVARGDEARRETRRLSEVVSNAVKMLRYQLEIDGIEVFEEHDEETPVSLFDVYAFQQVVFNLVNNARQAMQGTPAGSKNIAIRTGLAPEGPPGGDDDRPFLLFQVEDTGEGIPTEILHRIFEPFFTTKETGRGTGLGLSICYRIVRDHGGRIEASNRDDGGARFDVWLPISGGDPGPETPPETAARKSGGNGGTILVVDDERQIQELLEEGLGLVGHDVLRAMNGQEALDLLAEGVRPDVLILDLKMPVMSGQEFYRRLKEEGSDLLSRILFLTGDTLSRDAQEFLAATGRPYMSKPFSLMELRDEIASLLKEE